MSNDGSHHPPAARRRRLLLLILIGVVCVAPRVALPAEDDEAFIRALEASGPDDPVNRKRLAKLFFSVASTLDGAKSSVRLLQTALSPRDLAVDSVRRGVASRFQVYEDGVERFKGSVSALLDRPDSDATLFRVLSDGHRACWRLDAYRRIVETYGARSNDLMSILTSTEACARFRRVAFQAPVEALILRALDEAESQRGEIRDLKEELKELESLLEDLRRIDAGE